MRLVNYELSPDELNDEHFMDVRYSAFLLWVKANAEDIVPDSATDTAERLVEAVSGLEAESEVNFGLQLEPEELVELACEVVGVDR